MHRRTQGKKLSHITHALAENGHNIALEKLEEKAILNLDLRLGEGTGAVWVMSLIEVGVSILTQMVIFTEAEVSVPHLHK